MTRKISFKDYSPNLEDKRVRRKVKRALGCAIACFSSEGRDWSQSFIDKHIGTLQSNDYLGRWLRKTLLVCTDDFFDPGKGRTKKWALNQDGVTWLKDRLGRPVQTPNQRPAQTNHQTTRTTCSHITCLYVTSSPAQVEEEITRTSLTNLPYLAHSEPVFDQFELDLAAEWAEATFGPELRALTFEYEDKSSRLWHPLQMMRRAHKREVQAAAGLTWHYDIEACAPTLLLQYAQSLPETMDQWLPFYQDYLTNRQHHRLRLAEKMNCDPFFAKAAINALFAGAKVGAGGRFAIGRMLYSAERVKRFREDDLIIGLRNDIKVLWDYIYPSLGLRTKKDKNGVERRVPLSSRRKWGLYFDLERKVLDVVREYLTETGNPHFLEHDGWVTRDRVDTSALIERIHQQTGFSVKLEEDKHVQDRQPT